KSQREVEDLLILILLITASIILLLLILLFFAHRIILKKLWKPFFSTLSVINDFHLSKPINKNLPATDIDEFSALNDAWQRVTKKITTDYETVKSFADNASHEMQTPLAIINSKLDLLIQGHALNGDNVQHLQSMYDAVNKLTRLNQTLLLLTKIENDQYVEREAVNINDILSQRLDDMEELILTKKIKVTTDLRESVTTINPQLADMLVSNLLLNAIRHNIENGMINIICNRAGFQISNTGNTGSLNELIIFNRFQKDSKSAGVGLGLALVRQICETHHYTIEYRFEQHMHIFEVSF
ncbi:MAG TPA: HAMP domain-containing sensor histidine kinase, partial [Flavitalea sp.]|nr:HAMP domain-containing sensor histidine kinase [Flavitalea sp.]